MHFIWKHGKLSIEIARWERSSERNIENQNHFFKISIRLQFINDKIVDFPHKECIFLWMEKKLYVNILSLKKKKPKIHALGEKHIFRAFCVYWIISTWTQNMAAIDHSVYLAIWKSLMFLVHFQKWMVCFFFVVSVIPRHTIAMPVTPLNPVSSLQLACNKHKVNKWLRNVWMET